METKRSQGQKVFVRLLGQVISLSSLPSLEQNDKVKLLCCQFCNNRWCLYNLLEIVQLVRSWLPLSILLAPSERATSLVHHAPWYHRVVIKPGLPIEETLYENVLFSRPFNHWAILSMLTSLWNLYIATDIILHVISPRYTDGIPGISRFRQDGWTCTRIYSWQWPISLYQAMFS